MEPRPSIADAAHARIEILGVPISVLTPESTLAAFSGWVRKGRSRYVCVADVHSVMRAGVDANHMAAMRGADMITPDGTPLVWISRVRGEKRISRVCGPDLLPYICAKTLDAQWKHFFYGGADGVADQVAANLKADFPGLQIVGVLCPPFRPLTTSEDAMIVEKINASGADIVWVGLGCPKQERWMADHVGRLEGAVIVGIGAAFDFHSNRVHRAPVWMRRLGLEWLHRLLSEPKRLWQRYLILAPKFAVLAIAETVQLAFASKKIAP